MSFDDEGNLSDGNDLMYALTWHDAEGRPYYWSVYHGWVDDPAKAWTLTIQEVESIPEDDSLEAKLPRKKEARDGAEWLPTYRRFPLYAPGVTDEDYLDDDEGPILNRMIDNTGEKYG